MTLSTTDVQFLQDLIAERSGHVISDQHSYLFETKLQPVAIEAGLSDVAELVEKTRRSKTSLICDQITEAMTINETFFFRDMNPFDALVKGIVPTLMEQRQSARSLSVWANACSSGQEAYSIAISLREHFPELADWNVKILATDICEKVLAKAEKGEYSQFEVNRGMPAKLLIQYFDREGTNWVVKPEIRAMIEFRKLNLINPWSLAAKFDVVFLRNVLIYFSMDTKAAILKRVHRNMVDDGYLILGGGESMISIDVPFERETIENYTCFRPQS